MCNHFFLSLLEFFAFGKGGGMSILCAFILFCSGASAEVGNHLLLFGGGGGQDVSPMCSLHRSAVGPQFNPVCSHFFCCVESPQNLELCVTPTFLSTTSLHHQLIWIAQLRHSLPSLAGALLYIFLQPHSPYQLGFCVPGTSNREYNGGSAVHSYVHSQVFALELPHNLEMF